MEIQIDCFNINIEIQKAILISIEILINDPSIYYNPNVNTGTVAADCKKLLDSTNAMDHEGEMYCKACHGKKFGPKGYGFAGGAGTMLSMDTGKAYQVTKE